MKKKLLSMLLCSAMVVGMLTGCGSRTEENENPGSLVQTSSGFATSTGEDTSKETAKLRLIFYGDSSSRRDDFFKNEFHDAVLKDLNIDLTVEFMPWGSDTNVSTMLASGEQFAIEYIVQNYDWHTKGYLASIDEELIQKNMPDFMEARGTNNGFEDVKYNGEVYAIPFGNKAYSGSMQYFDVRGDICDELGVDPSKITTLEQLEDLFDKVMEAYPDMRIITNPDFLPYALYDEIGEGTRSLNEGNDFVFVNEEEDGDTVYSFVESESFKNLCEITERWAQKGYLNKDLITNPSQGEADWTSANCFARNGMPGCLISNSLKTANPNAYETMIKIGNQVDIKTKDYDWGIAISAADEENVEHWLQLFNWMYQDQEHYDFCVYGVGGVDYNVEEDGSITKLVSDSFIDGWFMESIPYNHYDASLSEEVIEKYKHFDDDAQRSKLCGFSFDTTPVASQLAMLTSVYNEEVTPMLLGFSDYDENYEKMLSDLKKAGLDEYIAEYQRQFSAYYEGND